MDYEEFKKKAGQLVEVDLNSYKSQQLDRRIKSLMDYWEIKSYQEFLEVLKTDPKRFHDFEKRLTINVSEFFRNPERFHEIWQHILPELLARHKLIRIWSAGCSNGAEPYSVAIILKELGAAERASILATDLDRTILEKARRAVYLANDVKHLPLPLIEKYFEPQNGHLALKPELVEMVEFRQQNLLLDNFESNLDFIICRNVVIYFTDQAKQQLYQKFYNALRPGGYLLMGGTEPILNYRNLGFTSSSLLFYQKPQRTTGGSAE